MAQAEESSILKTESSGTQGSVPLTLLDSIDLAKQKILICLELKGKKERVALAELEQLLISIGTMIEEEALEKLGLSNLAYLEAKLLGKFCDRIEEFSNTETWALKSVHKKAQEFLRYIELVQPYPGVYQQDKDRLKSKIKAANNIVKTFPADLLKIQKNIARKDPVLQAIYLSLRDAYLSTLKQVRGFGEVELEFEEYYNIINENRDEKPSKINQNLETLKKAVALLPNDWITTSNESTLLLLVKTTLMGDETGHLASYSPGSYFGANEVRFNRIKSSEKITMKGWWFQARSLNFRKQASEAAIVHELGHALTHLYPILGALQEAYYLRRTTKANGRRVKVKFVDGYFRRDAGFVVPAMGNDANTYSKIDLRESKKFNRSLTKADVERGIETSKKELNLIANGRLRYEVLSIGLESVLCGDNGYLAGVLEGKQDTELRHLILGILATV